MKRLRPPVEALTLALLLAACAGRGDAPPETGSLPGTALPTIAPVDAGALTAQASEASQQGLVLLKSFRGDVQPEAEAIFGLTGEAGEAVRIEVQVRLGEPDLALHLSTPSGEILANVDVGGPGESEVIGEFRLPAEGYYELAVQSLENTGQVDVLIYEISGEVLSGGGALPGLGQPVTGSMDRPATFHTYKLRTERGQRFDLRATALSGDLDLVFELYDPQGEPVVKRDDSLDKDPYLFNYMPQLSGDYTVVLTNFEGTTGTYQIIAEASQGGSPLDFGRRQVISLPTEPHHGAWVPFISTAGEGLSINADPLNPNTDLTLAVHDVFGNRLAFADNGGPGAGESLRVQVPYDGPYQLEFGTLSEGGEVRYDAYERSSFDFDTSGPLIEFPTLRDVTILLQQGGETHAYWFDGEQGQRITIDATARSGTLDLAFDLLDEAGNVLSAHDDDRNTDPVLENYPLPYTGRYYLVLKLEDTHLGGQYRLTASTPDPAEKREG